MPPLLPLQGAAITIKRCQDQTHGLAEGTGGCYKTLGAGLVPLLATGNAVSPVGTALAKTCPARKRGMVRAHFNIQICLSFDSS